MATQLFAGMNSAAFTTSAGAEAAIGILYVPTGNVACVNLEANVSFTTVNAATTALTVKVRQATVTAGNVVVAAPAGTQIAASAVNTFTAGTLTAQTVSFQGTDFSPVEIAVDWTLPAQASSLGFPGAAGSGGFLYVVTVTSTTNVATVAAQSAGFSVSW